MVISSIDSHWLKVTISMFFKFLNKQSRSKTIINKYKIIYFFTKKKIIIKIFNIILYLKCIHVLYVISILFCCYLCRVKSLGRFFSHSISSSYHLFRFNFVINYLHAKNIFIRILSGFYLFINK
jgi:hypothetical protein